MKFFNESPIHPFPTLTTTNNSNYNNNDNNRNNISSLTYTIAQNDK